MVDQPVADVEAPTEHAPKVEVAAVPDASRPYEDLPDQVLAEETVQVAAEYADATRVATNAVRNLADLENQVEEDRGPEVSQVRVRHVANQERLEAMKQARAATKLTDAAQAKTAALAVQVMDAEDELAQVRGAFSARRRLEAEQRLDDVRAAHERQRDKMFELDAHSHALTVKLGTAAQQKEALSLRDADYQQRLDRQLEQAREEDREALLGSREWVVSSEQRQERAAHELAQLTAEQALRAENPDPAAELQRQQTYERQQEEAAEAASWEYTGSWDPDLDLPAAPDTSMER